jgi:hypothetical protein
VPCTKIYRKGEEGEERGLGFISLFALCDLAVVRGKIAGGIADYGVDCPLFFMAYIGNVDVKFIFR